MADSPINEYPTSIKAALRQGDRWILVRNDRGEWELPGGRPDSGDGGHDATVRRECLEELGVEVVVGPHVSTYVFEVVPGHHVNIICYAATVPAHEAFTLSDEHTAVGIFARDELADANVPSGYRSAIELAADLAE